MCTAISFKTENHYFGRTLDLQYHYNEKVTVTPRNYVFKFRKSGEIKSHFAIIGMATVENGYPLYYDAVNEKGLGIAGLNFPKNAFYGELKENKKNVAPFEFIPWILSTCETVKDAEKLLENTNVAKIDFSEKFPTAPLHWIISDKNKSITVECVKDGMKIYENPVGVLTNNPPFEMQIFNLNNYMQLTREDPKDTFCNGIRFDKYSNGMGAMGLPGDLSSMSRFVRACFTKLNSVCETDEISSVSQFFHILGAVAQTRGCARVEGDFEITVYTSCCNTEKGIYYYTTYENRQINAVNMYSENLDGENLIIFELADKQNIKYHN